MSKEKDSRAISERFMEMFENGGVYHQFVELVISKPELCFSFRGNNGDNEAVNIYYNNKTVFKIYLNGTVEISFNHARYKSDWRKDLEKLAEIGFKIPEQSEEKIAKSGIGYIRGKIETLKPNAAIITYENVIKPIMDSYFDEESDVRYDYFRNEVGQNRYEKEKVRQHEIFLSMKNYKDGYFFYDTEFHQVYENNLVKGVDFDSHNNPDMTAIRFENGRPVAFVLVEVKSTKSAMFGKSGVLTHIRMMEKYEYAKIQNRLVEAYEMMTQYRQLQLYEIPQYEKEDFTKINLFENILLFTDEAKEIWERPYEYLTNKRFIADIEEAHELTELVDDRLILRENVPCSVYKRK